MCETIGGRLAKVRVEKGYKQKEVADYLGIAASTLTGYEKDKRAPSAEMVYKLADFYGVSPRYIVTGHMPKIQHGCLVDWGENRSFFAIPYVENFRFDATNNEWTYCTKALSAVEKGISFYEFHRLESKIVWIQVHDELASMHILPGSYVLLSIQDHVEDGSIAFVSVDNEPPVCRRIYRKNGHVILDTANPLKKNQTYDTSKVQIIGEILGTATIFPKAMM